MHDRVYLENCSLSTLRSYARQIGVSGVTNCKKSGLIKKIMAVEAGKRTPASRRGRKPLNGQILSEECPKKFTAEQISEIFREGLKLAQKEFENYVEKELNALLNK